jgi:hypothetical protein
MQVMAPVMRKTMTTRVAREKDGTSDAWLWWGSQPAVASQAQRGC